LVLSRLRCECWNRTTVATAWWRRAGRRHTCPERWEEARCPERCRQGWRCYEWRRDGSRGCGSCLQGATNGAAAVNGASTARHGASTARHGASTAQHGASTARRTTTQG
jgi:hypothetical protein